MYGILQSAGEMKYEMNRKCSQTVQLYILFEKSNNSCVFIDFWALYWTETAARDGKQEDGIKLTIASCMFLVKNDPCVGLFAKNPYTTIAFIGQVNLWD